MAPPEKDPAAAPSKERLPAIVVAVIALALVVLNVLNLFDGLNQRWVDWMFLKRGIERADARIVIVGIDDESLKKVGQFPWPRSVYPVLLDKLFAHGAKVVAMDILFPDPSRPEEDAALVQATSRWADRLVHSVDLEPDESDRTGQNVFRHPFPALKKAARHFGLVSQPMLDPDGHPRRTPLLVGRSNNRLDWEKDPDRMPVLSVKLLSLYEGKTPKAYLEDAARPMDRWGLTRNMVELNYRGQGLLDDGAWDYGIPRIRAWKVLKDALSREEKARLKGSIILVASMSVGAFDHYPTAFHESVPGVEVHANVLDNILNRRELRPTRWWATPLLVIAFAALAAWALTLAPLAATALVLAALIGWGTANFAAFHRLVVLQFWEPTLALFGTYAVLFVRRTFLEQKEKRFIKQTFGQFVAPEVVDQLVKDPSKVKLGGEKREMTVFFLDIAHFTTISEKMDPEALILFLNRYLSALSQVVHDHKGVVDKYIGDCIMAFWNAPLEQKDHRALGCLAAVECMEALKVLNTKLDGGVPEKPAIRIGVNSGFMTVGLTGSQQKLQYTVVGDEVNLGSRLEGANKFFGSNIMVSEACYHGGRDSVEARELGRIRVVGKSVPIRVFEPLSKKGALPEAWRRAMPLYEDGLRLFEKGVELAYKEKKPDPAGASFGEAKTVFAEVLKIVPEDAPAKRYRDLCEDYSVLPPQDWDGVFNLEHK